MYVCVCVSMRVYVDVDVCLCVSFCAGACTQCNTYPPIWHHTHTPTHPHTHTYSQLGQGQDVPSTRNSSGWMRSASVTVR